MHLSRRGLLAAGSALGAAGAVAATAPGAAAHGDEPQVLSGAIRRVASSGAGVVFFSHGLDEVLELADRVVVSRGGRVAAEQATTRLDHDTIVRLIAGREIAETVVTSVDELGDPVLT
ncbi:hypothetical protein JFN87_17420, partial [Streptomyces bomunensis]|nr:hypothetical protein [Streptomyces montanisoli]